MIIFVQNDCPMKRNLITFSIIALLAVSCSSGPYDKKEFSLPDISWRPTPLWFWNNCEVTPEGVETGLKDMIERDFYGGCSILAFGRGFSPEYLSDEYFEAYAQAVEVARSYGAKMSLYDEYGFPSGGMGAVNADGVTRFADKYPQHCIKRLDKHEYKAPAGRKMVLDLSSDGLRMATDAMDKNTGEVRALGTNVSKDGILEWQVPEKGDWTVMNFTLEKCVDPIVDYLSPEAVGKFVEEVHEKYYEHFGDAFGSTIVSTFFDEPTMYRAEGRMWTEDFNERFMEIYKCDPEPFYPALWYQIGPTTSAARNMMYGTRAKMYSEGFMKVIAEWAEAHEILSTGHQDQEEIVNPVGLSGDLMLCGKYMSMPGIDKIGGDRPAENFYKLISSSAQNWDKDYVMSETYGAMGNLSMDELYAIAIEQYTKGITNLIPHAVWYDDSNVTFLPELSSRNPLYCDYLPDFNRFLSRLNYVLQRPGRHVADIAVLYPIQTLQAGHYFDGPEGRIMGSVKVPGSDYNRISAILTDELGKDFTYIHPEVLDEKCDVSAGKLTMRNKRNREEFSTLILPGVKTISVSNMGHVFEAWRSGVHVIFTTQLPCECADMDGTDWRISSLVSEMMSAEVNPAVFVSDPTPEALAKALSAIDSDVNFDGSALNYIHKVVDGHDVYLFGNIDDAATTTTISLRSAEGRWCLMDPHTGTTTPAALKRTKDGRHSFTITLEPSRSVFLVSR